MSTETKSEFAERLRQAVVDALGTEALPNPEGWRVGEVKLMTMRGGDARLDENRDPVLRFELPDRALFIAVLPNDPGKPAFRRTRHFDVMYMQADKDEDGGQGLYAQNRDLLDRFANWVDQWDADDTSGSTPEGEAADPGEGTPSEGA